MNDRKYYYMQHPSDQLCTSTKMLACPVSSELMVAPKDDCFFPKCF